MSRTGTKYIRVTPSERRNILELWTSGAGNVKEIASAMKRPKGTIYGVLRGAGVWPGFDDYTKARTTKPEKVKHRRKSSDPEQLKMSLPEPVLVEPGSITIIRGPERSLWQRIKEFFQ